MSSQRARHVRPGSPWRPPALTPRSVRQTPCCESTLPPRRSLPRPSCRKEREGSTWPCTCSRHMQRVFMYIHTHRPRARMHSQSFTPAPAYQLADTELARFQRSERTLATCTWFTSLLEPNTHASLQHHYFRSLKRPIKGNYRNHASSFCTRA